MLFPSLHANSQTDQLEYRLQIPNTNQACHHVLVILLFLIEIDESFHPSRFHLVAQGQPHALHRLVESLVVQQVFLEVVPKDRQGLWIDQPCVTACLSK
jgi:hypothetical protein